MTPGSEQTEALLVDRVAKAFGEAQVLRDVVLDASEGELIAILGASGSGKTTLLRLIAGLERTDSGTIAIDSRTVDGNGRFTPPERRRVGYLPQEGALFPHLTVAGNIGFALGRDRLRRQTTKSRKRVEQLVAMVDLQGLERRYPHQLSGGERQRVALARALAPEPRLMLLDEPFSSLDAELRATVRREVVTVLRRAETTAVLVTHDQDEALSVADRVALLQHGAIAQHDTPSNLYRRPANPRVARFIGHGNLLPAHMQSGEAHCVLGPIPILLNEPAADGSALTILIRPEQISIEAIGANGNAPASRGTVIAREFHGHDVLLTIKLAPAEAAASTVENRREEVLARVADAQSPDLGDHVTLYVSEPAVAWLADDQHPSSDGPR